MATLTSEDNGVRLEVDLSEMAFRLVLPGVEMSFEYDLPGVGPFTSLETVPDGRWCFYVVIPIVIIGDIQAVGWVAYLFFRDHTRLRCYRGIDTDRCLTLVLEEPAPSIGTPSLKVMYQEAFGVILSVRKRAEQIVEGETPAGTIWPPRYPAAPTGVLRDVACEIRGLAVQIADAADAAPKVRILLGGQEICAATQCVDFAAKVEGPWFLCLIFPQVSGAVQGYETELIVRTSTELCYALCATGDSTLRVTRTEPIGPPPSSPTEALGQMFNALGEPTVEQIRRLVVMGNWNLC